MAPESRNGYSLAVLSVGVALVVLFAGAGVIAAVGHEVPKEMWSAAAALSGALVGILVPAPKTKKDAQGSATVAAAITHSAATTAALDRAAEVAADPGATAAVKRAAAAAAADVRGSGAEVARAATDATGSGQLPTGIVDAAIAVHDVGLTKATTAVSRAETAAIAPDAGQAAVTPELRVARASQSVHQAAVDAAKGIRSQADAIARTGDFSPAVSKLKESLKVGLPALVFIVSLGLGLAIAGGLIHPSGCSLTDTNRIPVCDLPLIHISNELMALASAAGGALIGLFANPPSSRPAKAPA
jgi:hypothetical protein